MLLKDKSKLDRKMTFSTVSLEAMIKSDMAKRALDILFRLILLIAFGKGLGFDYTITSHWIILGGLGAVIFSLGYIVKYVWKILRTRYSQRFLERYAEFSKRPMNIVTIFYITVITLPTYICLFLISGIFWSILSWFYRLFHA